MTKRTWKLAPRAAKPKVDVPDDVRTRVSSEAEQVLTALRRRLKGTETENRPFNTPEDVSTHWHRNAFFFAVTYLSRSPRSIQPSFTTNIARIEYNEDGTFTLGFPMRREWTVTLSRSTLEECLEAVKDGAYF